MAYRIAASATAIVVALLVNGLRTPAPAHYVWECLDTEHDQDTHKVNGRLDGGPHDRIAESSARGLVGVGDVTGANDWCTREPRGGGSASDIWLGLYVDRLVGGAWYQCRSSVPGWRGSDETSGWWTTTIGWTALRDACEFTRRWNRVRVQGRAWFRDGHVTTLWYYSEGHAPVADG